MAGKPRQDGDARLAAALARGEKVEAAARLAGISGRTAFRRARDPDIHSLVREARSCLVRRVAGKLAGAGDQGVETLVALLADDCPRLRLGAAKAILEHLCKFAFVEEVEEM